MILALVSLLTDKPVSADVAMTGEISLRGLVMPIGGLKEKTLAALRAGIKTVMVPEAQREGPRGHARPKPRRSSSSCSSRRSRTRSRRDRRAAGEKKAA